MFKTLRRIFTSRPASPVALSRVENKIGYTFKKPELLLKALTHLSYVASQKKSVQDSNERMEFLGDAVLELIITQYLYNTFANKREGELSKIKSILVSRRVLARIISELHLGEFLLMNRGEEQTDGRTRASNLANLYESLLGAVYLDGGLPAAERFISRTLLSDYDRIISDERNINFKSILLEYVQGKRTAPPVYRLIADQGPDHEKLFTVEVKLNTGAHASGTGRSKKLAEQEAARALLHEVAPQLLENNTPEVR